MIRPIKKIALSIKTNWRGELRVMTMKGMYAAIGTIRLNATAFNNFNLFACAESNNNWGGRNQLIIFFFNFEKNTDNSRFNWDFALGLFTKFYTDEVMNSKRNMG